MNERIIEVVVLDLYERSCRFLMKLIACVRYRTERNE